MKLLNQDRLTIAVVIRYQLISLKHVIHPSLRFTLASQQKINCK